MPQMGWLARQDGYDPNAFDVPLDQGTNVGWANRLGEILTTRPQYDESTIYQTASPLVSITEGDIGRATEAALGGMTVTPKGIRAYHSSPHDFDKFDLAKIGSGEGAQVYGHGLYFAESPAVSGQGGEYWKQFLGRFQGTPEGLAARELMQSEFNRPKAIGYLERHLKSLDELGLDAMNPDYAQARVALERLRSGNPVGPRTYEVNINADPAHMLDWDKALYQQPEVYDKIRGYADTIRDMKLQEGYKDFLDAAELRGMPGSDFYHVAKKQGSAALSQDLREAGIPGIKYLDQGSRAVPATLERMQRELADYAARGNKSAVAALEQQIADAQRAALSSNYVVFDPGIIDIMKKYGLAGAAPVGMGALAAQNEYEGQY